MEGLVIASFVLQNQYQSQRSARNIPEPEFKPFNLAALRLPKDAEVTARGAKPNRQPALAVSAA
jgi:hypothetical protein